MNTINDLGYTLELLLASNGMNANQTDSCRRTFEDIAKRTKNIKGAFSSVISQYGSFYDNEALIEQCFAGIVDEKLSHFAVNHPGIECDPMKRLSNHVERVNKKIDILSSNLELTLEGITDAQKQSLQKRITEAKLKVPEVKRYGAPVQKFESFASNAGRKLELEVLI